MDAYAEQLVEERRDFGGDRTRTLDDKGRLVFPAEFRDEFTDGLWVMKGADSCVEIWTAEGHKQRKLDVIRKPMTSRANRLQRHVVTSARRLDLDSQYRVTLPQEMRSHASLDRDIVVKGNLNHVQVWDRAIFRKFDREAGGYVAEQDDPDGP